MPRLEQNPEYKRAAKLAEVGPETWNSWIGALAVVANGFEELTKNAPVGSLLRALGRGKQPDKPGTGKEELEKFVLDYAFPGGSNVGGVVKGLKAGIRKGKPGAAELRKLMAEEFRLRGKVPTQAAGSDPEWFSRLLRGTPYHAGQYEKFPRLAEKFNPHLGGAGNLGEPQGISLTYNPTELYGNKGAFVRKPRKWNKVAGKLQKTYAEISNEIGVLNANIENGFVPEDKISQTKEKLRRLYDKRRMVNTQAYKYDGVETTDSPFTRVLPRFHGAPESAVLKGWKGGGDEQLFKDAYVYALNQMPLAWSNAFGRRQIPDYAYLSNVLADSTTKKEFNTHITRYLQSKGKRGVLYLPQRYDEYELRVFDPRDVVMLDERTMRDAATRRSTGDPGSGSDYVNSNTYDPYADILVPHFKPSRRKEVLSAWEDELANAGHPSDSLGDIYRDIDLPSLELAPDAMRQTQREEVTIGALANAAKAEQEGLRLQQGEPRVRGRRPRQEDRVYTPHKEGDLISEDGQYLFSVDGELMDTFTGQTWSMDEQLIADVLAKHNWNDVPSEAAKSWEGVGGHWKKTNVEPGAPGVDPVGMKPWVLPEQEGYLDDLGYTIDKDKGIALHKSGNDLFDLTTGKVHAKGTTEYSTLYDAPTKLEQEVQKAMDESKSMSIKIKTPSTKTKIPL